MTLFPEWQDSHPPQKYIPERIRTMWNAYGKNENTHCRTCRFLVHNDSHTKSYLKCSHNKITHGAGTDWRAGWTACGLHEPGPQKHI